MGCGISSGHPTATENAAPNHLTYSQRKTRIIQEEEVDVCVNDEYDVVDTEWANGPEGYEVIEETDEWIPGVSAGGSRNDLELFATNPQFILSLGPAEKHPDTSLHPYLVQPPDKEDSIPVSICLVQHGSEPPLHVAFFIYKVDGRNERLSPEYFLVVPPEADTGAFVNWRQLRHDFNLYPGLYVLVAATFRPHRQGRFTLSVQAKPPFSFGQLLEINDI
ncbi:Hypothetical protein NTJ_08638 [Nesidiocoris tenuis]|uniref:Peptidase C2 calpain domain-containing protein n=1 Tax=Nesidiocoris tenuis TaxID=355587 RepID=A0ABN7AUG5_9HEMI|nr:Hypothetical protein NTJ_08638 [Nesidiocoris tenuis]